MSHLARHGKKSRGLTSVALIAAFSIGSSIPCVATTHYVSHSGSNAFPYDTWATATDSLRAAIEAANAYDTIRVAAGNYTCDSLLLKKGQVFLGSGRDSTYLLHNGTFPGLLVLADSSTTRGFHFDGITDTAFGGTINFHLNNAVGAFTDVNALFTNCRITNTQTAILLFFNSANHPSYRVHVDSCEVQAFEKCVDAVGTSTRITNNLFIVQYSVIGYVFHQVGRNAELVGNRFRKTVQSPGEAIVQLDPIDTVRISNNLVICDTISRGAAIWLNKNNSGVVVEGAITNNSFIGGEFGLFTGASNALVRNNMFIATRRVSLGPMYDDDSSVQYNLFWQAQEQGPAFDTANLASRHNLFVNPMLADTESFYLEMHSPAINSGDTSILDADSTRSDIGHTGGPLGVTYVYEDRPPATPQVLDGQVLSGVVNLHWVPNSEADFLEYRLYRNTSPISVIMPSLLWASVSPDTVYADSAVSQGTTYYYRLTAVDAQSLESPLSPEVIVSLTGVNEPPISPTTFELEQAYPNPFNAETTIPVVIRQAQAGQAGYLEVSIYSIAGRQVTRLFEGYAQSGRHLVKWNGRDAFGSESASGTYIVRAKYRGTTRSERITLLK